MQRRLSDLELDLHLTALETAFERQDAPPVLVQLRHLQRHLTTECRLRSPSTGLLARVLACGWALRCTCSIVLAAFLVVASNVYSEEARPVSWFEQASASFGVAFVLAGAPSVYVLLRWLVLAVSTQCKRAPVPASIDASGVIELWRHLSPVQRCHLQLVLHHLLAIADVHFVGPATATFLQSIAVHVAHQTTEAPPKLLKHA